MRLDSHYRAGLLGAALAALLLASVPTLSRADPGTGSPSERVQPNASAASLHSPGRPLWLEQEFVGLENCNGFSQAVALSGDTAFIGLGTCYYGNPTPVQVYDRIDGTWTNTQSLLPNDAQAGDGFGTAIAVSGATLLVAAPAHEVNGNAFQGATYVFTKNNGSWVQSATLTASDGTANQAFGIAIAFDGSTALIASEAGNGSVYVFSDDNGTWTQEQELTASDGARGECFGCALALDGTTAVVGASNAKIGANYGQGAAYVFADQSGTWTQTQKLVADDGGEYDGFGVSLLLHTPELLVGAPGAATPKGAIYHFSDNAGTWGQAGKFIIDDASGLGASMATTDNGYLLFGAPDTSVHGNASQGAVYVYKRTNGALQRVARITSSNGFPSDFFGSTVAGNDDTVLAGAPFRSDGFGAAYFYRRWNVGFAFDAPAAVPPGGTYSGQLIVTNNKATASPDVTVVDAILPPVAASYVSATPSQGSCNFGSAEPATCSLGPIAGNGGTATVNVTVRVLAPAGATLTNHAYVASSPLLGEDKPTVVDNPPVAYRGAVSTTVGKPVYGRLRASDPDPNTTLRFEIVRQPSHGTVLLQAATGVFRYTPAPGYTGVDGFLFRASDGLLLSNKAVEAVRVAD